MKNMWQTTLMDEADDDLFGPSSGGAGVSDNDNGGDNGDNGDDLFADDPSGQQQQQQPQQPPAFDYDALARANAAAFAQFQPQHQQQQKPEMSDEEFARLTKKFMPDANVAKALFGDNATPQQEEALRSLVNGIYQHLYTATGMTLKGEMDAFREQLTPLQQERAEARERSFAEATIKRVPALKPYAPLVRSAMKALRDSQWQPQARDEAGMIKETQRAIATMVETHVKTFNPQFSLRQGQSQGGRAGMPRMTSMSNGGGNGGSGSGAGGKKPGWASVLGA